MIIFSAGGKAFVSVPMYQLSGWSTYVEESSNVPVAPGGLSVTAGGASARDST